MFLPRLMIISALCLVISVSTWAQTVDTKPDAKTILTKVRQVYAESKSYHCVHEMAIEGKFAGEKTLKPWANINMIVASEREYENTGSFFPINTDRCRLEAKADNDGLLLVGNNGCVLHSYSKNEYMKGSSLYYVSTSVSGSMMMCLYLQPFLILDGRGIDKVQMIREETISLGKEKRRCFVLEGRMKVPAPLEPGKLPDVVVLGIDHYLTNLSLHGLLKPVHAALFSMGDDDKASATLFWLWIDAENYTLLKSKLTAAVYKHDPPIGGVERPGAENSQSGLVEVSLTDTFSVAKVNTQLPDELFKFTAPARSKEIPNVRSRNKK